MSAAPRVLVAGVGNLLRGDDGFGVRVVQRLAASPLPENVCIREIGISGISLVHELMAGYDACIIVDVSDRGRPPGTLYVLQPQLPEKSGLADHHRALVDMHYAEPSLALPLAQALGVLPPKVHVVACQPETLEEFSENLSPAVESAVELAVTRIQALISEIARG